jgi:hypothetical protein
MSYAKPELKNLGSSIRVIESCPGSKPQCKQDGPVNTNPSNTAYEADE